MESTFFPDSLLFSYPIFRRLNAGGTLDSTFSPDQQWLVVTSIAIQGDGRIVIGGSFQGDLPRVLRIMNDGSPDTSFTPVTVQNRVFNTLFPGRVDRILLTPEEKVLIAGLFTLVDDSAWPGLARLNQDGTLDTGFVALVLSWPALVQPDGKTVGRGNSSNIIRVHPNGTLDPNFDPGSGLGGRDTFPLLTPTLTAAALQPDGKIVIGGRFLTVNGADRRNLARVNPLGILDSSFDPGAGILLEPYADIPPVKVLALQADGRIIVGGRFTTVNGIARNNLARLWGGDAPLVQISPANAGLTPSGAFELTLSTALGKTYGLQYKDSLSDTRWLTLFRSAGDGTEQCFVDTNLVSPQRFYRLIIE